MSHRPQNREEAAARGDADEPMHASPSPSSSKYRGAGADAVYEYAEQRPRGRSGGCCGVLSTVGNFCIRIVHAIVPPGGILSGAFNMASASVGAGILGLPAATDSAGLLLSMIYLVIITYLSVFSMYILALTAQSTRIRSFEGMARWLFPYGHYAFSYWVAFIRWFHSFAACVAYVISLGNCFSAIFDSAKEKYPDNKSMQFLTTTQGNRLVTCGVWLFVMVPLVVPKHIDSLRYASAIAITFMVYFVIVVVVHSCRFGMKETRHHVKIVGAAENDKALGYNAVFLFRTGNSVVHSVGVFVFAYVVQINALEVLADFRPEIRTPRYYTYSAVLAMALCGTLYVLVCVFGYFDFGTKLAGQSLLLMFSPLDEADVMIAYVGVLVKLCVAYALLGLAARNSLYYLIGFQQRYRNRPAPLATVSSAEDLNPSPTKQQQQHAAPAAMECGDAGDDMLPGLDVEIRKNAQEISGRTGAPICADDVDKEFVDTNDEDTTFIDNIPFWQHLIVVLVLSVASLLCGLFIPNINTVFGFAGAISGGFIAFVFPALFFMYSGNFSVAQVGWFVYLNTYFLLICGVIGIVFGTGGTIYETI